MSFRLIALLLGLIVALAAGQGLDRMTNPTDGSAAGAATAVVAVTAVMDRVGGGAGTTERGAKHCDGSRGYGLGGPGCAGVALPPGEPLVLSARGSISFGSFQARLPVGLHPEPPRYPPRTMPA